MQQRATSHQHYAYKRQPSNQVYTSTFNPTLPGGHMSNIKQFQGNPYEPAISAYNSSAQPVVPRPTSTTESTSPLSNFNLSSLAKYANVDELKGLVDRFGGLDGILATVTKVQKVMSTVGQIAPMAKVFTGLLGNKKSSSGEQEQADTFVPARRKQVSKRSNLKNKGRRVQVNKRKIRTKKSQVYTNTQRPR